MPVIDFLFQQKHQQLPEGQSVALRKYLYMSFFMRFYSHGADAKLDFIHNMIANNKLLDSFPINFIGQYMESRTGVPFDFSPQMLNDVDLVLNIIQGDVSEIPKVRGWSLERDHIFPRDVLEGNKFDSETIDRVGNLRFVNKTRNIMRSNILPDSDLEFFGSNESEIKLQFEEVRQTLAKANYMAFVGRREELMRENVRDFLGFRKREACNHEQPIILNLLIFQYPQMIPALGMTQHGPHGRTRVQYSSNPTSI